ncbi:MAG: hypothetical protein H7257_05800 [Taibaiella sp.]|nr:hypothetical protein [Taibaiella sp.]
MRLKVMICICLLFGIGCKNTRELSRNTVDRSILLAALNDFKNAVNAKDSGSIHTFLPNQIIQDNYFETKDVINTCKGFFEHLDINRLKTSDTILSKNVEKGSPCLENFAIIVVADSVTLAYKMDKNPDYKMTEKDIAEELDHSSLCEHMTWYNFKVIQGKLKLTSLGGAD